MEYFGVLSSLNELGLSEGCLSLWGLNPDSPLFGSIHLKKPITNILQMIIMTKTNFDKNIEIIIYVLFVEDKKLGVLNNNKK